MKITRDNYEIYFIDHLDGNLSPSEEEILMSFLVQNPDLAEELEGIKSCVLEPQAQTFSQKDTLKKTSSTHYGIDREFDYLCIAELEGDLSNEERARLDTLLSKDKKKQAQRSLYSDLKLKPNIQISFHGKSSIKRSIILNLRKSTIRKTLSLAAGFAMLIGVFTLFRLVDIEEEKIVQSTKYIESNDLKELDKATHKEDNDTLPIDPINTPPEKVEPPKMQAIHKPKTIVEITTPTNDYFALATLEPVGLAEIKLPKPQVTAQSIALGKVKAIHHEEISEQKETATALALGRTRTIGAFELAQIGVSKLADLTGSTIELSAEKEPEGTIRSIRFESNLFAFSTPVRKNK